MRSRVAGWQRSLTFYKITLVDCEGFRLSVTGAETQRIIGDAPIPEIVEDEIQRKLCGLPIRGIICFFG